MVAAERRGYVARLGFGVAESRMVPESLRRQSQ